MFRLDLTPLPCAPPADASTGQPLRCEDGFVDEGVVTALLTQPVAGRAPRPPVASRLTADAMDFAGWQLAPGIDAARGMPQPLRAWHALA